MSAVFISANEVKELLTGSKAKSQHESQDPFGYGLAYPLLVEGVKLLRSGEKPLTQASLTVFLHMAYGWMPKILRTPLDEPLMDQDVQDFNALIGAISISEVPEAVSVITRLKRLTNNSTVGLSKALHFLNPETYPMWDSRLINVIVPGVSNAHAFAQNAENYIAYLTAVTDWLNDGDVRELAKSMAKGQVTDRRALEFALFLSGKPD